MWRTRFDNINCGTKPLLDAAENRKEIVPVVICHLQLHTEGTRKEITDTVFQFTPDSLDVIIDDIRKFKDSMQNELGFIENKLSTESG